MPGWPTKMATIPNIMKTFHSSGTPIGIDERMPKWKMSMTAAATAVSHPPPEKNSTSGTKPSTAVEMCAIQRERRPGRRSSGKCSKNVRLMVGDRQIGLFDIIVAITNGKCLLSLLVAAPTQMTRKTSLAPRIMSVPTNRNVTQNAPYTSPRAARKTVLSRRPRTARSAMIVAICQIGRTRRRSAGRRSSVTPSSRVHHDHHQECRIEGDVEGAAGVSGGEWDLGPGWLANGLEAQPVEDRSHRREESVVERAEAATQSDDLEQHRVEHDLLEDDRFVVPGGDIEDAVDTGGGHHNRPADDDVGEDLAHVEQVQRHRRTETDLGPVPRHRLDLLGAAAGSRWESRCRGCSAGEIPYVFALLDHCAVTEPNKPSERLVGERGVQGLGSPGTRGYEYNFHRIAR